MPWSPINYGAAKIQNCIVDTFNLKPYEILVASMWLYYGERFAVTVSLDFGNRNKEKKIKAPNRTTAEK